MPVHLLWGMTRDTAEPRVIEDVSNYEPRTQTEEPIPETNPLELRPSTQTEEED